MTCQERAANGSLLAQVAAAAVAKVAEEGGRRIKQLSQRGARLARPPTVRLARMRGAKLVMWSGKVDGGGRTMGQQTYFVCRQNSKRCCGARELDAATRNQSDAAHADLCGSLSVRPLRVGGVVSQLMHGVTAERGDRAPARNGCPSLSSHASADCCTITFYMRFLLL